MKILVMGLPGSGKTYLSERLQPLLEAAWFNADKVRSMAGDWDFSEEGRLRQSLRMKSIADFESSHNRIVICDFVCPTAETRKIFDADITIWLDTINEGRFEDTNAIFEKPEQVDYLVTEWNEHNHIDIAEEIKIEFAAGDPIALNDKKMSPALLLARLNELGGKHGIGRLDLVENRFIGMKSRGIYETPGGTILLKARRAMESLTLDRGAAHLKDSLMPKYAELIYNGFWFSPEREMLQAAIDHSQTSVNGEVKLKLYKGNVMMIGRYSSSSLYSEDLVTFEEGTADYNHSDAEGFIKLNALRLRVAEMVRQKNKSK